MQPVHITRVTTRDARFQLKPGEGVDAIHTAPQYAYAVAILETDRSLTGIGLALTLGPGTDMVCSAIETLGEILVGREIHELMAGFGGIFRQIADHPQLRWLGPHKGVVHLALASLTNACFDLWAKARDVPLWQLLIDLTPEQVVALLDFSYLEDVLTPADAVALLQGEAGLPPRAGECPDHGLSGLRHLGGLVPLQRRPGAGKCQAGRGRRVQRHEAEGRFGRDCA